MPRRATACISLTIALLATPAGAHAADVVRPISVSAATTVPAGAVDTLSLRCPARAVALNAAVTRQDAGVSVRSSIPGRGSGTWRFRLAAAEDASSGTVRAVLRCVRLALPEGVSGVDLLVKTRRQPEISIPPGSSEAVQLRCGGAWAATGYGLDVGTASGVRIAAAVPAAHGWNFNLENTGLVAASARVSMRCLKRIVRGRREGASTSLRFQVARPEFRNEVGPVVDRGFSNACGRRQFSVATGVSFDWQDDIELRRSFPAAPWAGVWTFQQADGSEEVRSFLVCLSRRTQFG